METDVHFQNFT